MKTRLKEIRKSTGMTQPQAAEALGEKLGTYQSWEQGKSQLDGNKIIKIAKFFGVTPNDIFDTDWDEIKNPGMIDISRFSPSDQFCVHQFIDFLHYKNEH